MTDTDINHPDPDRKKILNLYAAFGVGLVLCVVPRIEAAILCIIFILYVLIAAYAMRRRAGEDSLGRNHAAYIIRTIWIGSFISALTVIAAALYLYKFADNTPLDPCLSDIARMNPDTIANIRGLEDLFGTCSGPYWDSNFNTFVVAAAIAAIPPFIYFLVRYARGLSRAIGGYRVAKPEAWF